ncbi:MAG: phosphoribosylformylglycinamidine cyclo-ligase [Magnetococcales bacterium]|nr:phosphoribosylformylglycinamidine cyclo-ligase [Magnetococcales bacterium]NGZ05583.1 phosphoribosylformylglycinamidine cyclo-ligase [Magnetococcales bacterium]
MSTSTPPPTDPPRPSITYRDAGVDIAAGNRVVDLIRQAVASTGRPGVIGGIGGFGALFRPEWQKFSDPILVASTDGVGTKLKLAFMLDRHDTVGIDLVAMSVNDLVVQGAEPLFFLDYFATGALNPEVAATVIQGIAEGCRQAGCALVGGETAEMPAFYPPGEYDLAGFAVGIVDRARLIDGSTITPTDAVIGMASSGPHSNGYSLIRRLVLPPHGPGLDHLCPTPEGDKPLGELLLAPTRIYVRSILKLTQQVTVKGLVHITGGGFTENIPRILPEGMAVTLDQNAWPRSALFDLLQELGNIEAHEMHRTFNCGIGMIAIVAESDCAAALESLTASGENAWRIGSVTSWNHPSDPRVTIHG